MDVVNIIRKNMRSLLLNRQGQVESARVCYVVNDSEYSGDDEMLSKILEYAPQKLGSANAVGIELVECRTPGVFETEVIYVTPAAQEQETQKCAAKRHGDRIWSSRCGVIKEKCYETLSRQESFPAADSANCSAGHSVVWNGRFGEDASVDGIDKLVPKCEEECRKYILASQCSISYRKNLLSLVGKLNYRSFHGWSAQEVMLTKLEISEPFINDLDQSLVEIRHIFSICRHRRDVDWCGIEVGNVKGWDRLWGTFYADPVDRIIKGNCAYVGRLYETADFGILSLED